LPIRPLGVSNPMTSIFLERNALRLVSALALWIFAALPLDAKDAKMKADAVVAKHLASIGTPEAVAAARNRAISGTAQVIFRLPQPGLLSGTSTVYSEGRRASIGMAFSTAEYSSEQLAYDGNKVTVGQVRPGQRSPLSEFIYHFDVLMKEGLLGGAMITAWALLDVPGRQPKLEYTGIKKYEGKQLHELKYRAKKGAGDLQISLYFEQETFRHLYTQIRLMQPAGMGSTPMESAQKRDTFYTLVESYDDFQTVDSLSLPHAYKLVQTIEAQNATVLLEYKITATQILHNQTFEPKMFTAQ